MLHLLSWIGLAGVGLVQAQTLYNLAWPLPQSFSVSETDADGFSFSADGVGADGMTTYMETATISGSVAQTAAVTIVEGASGLRYSFPGDDGPGVTCTWGADGKGACVEAVVVGGSTAVTATQSGSAIPIFTLNAATAPSQTTLSTNSARATFSMQPTPLAALIAIIIPTVLRTLLFFVAS